MVDALIIARSYLNGKWFSTGENNQKTVIPTALWL
jgi:hypothetical protein